jgi:hypothetical protein
MKKIILLTCILLVVVLFSGCPSTTVSTPSAPVVLAQSLKAVADADGAAIDALRVARTNSTISTADFNTAEDVLATVANVGLQIDAEQQSSDDWTTQKSKILILLQNTGLAQLKTKVSVTTYNIVVTVITAVNTLSVSLGGPTI